MAVVQHLLYKNKNTSNKKQRKMRDIALITAKACMIQTKSKLHAPHRVSVERVVRRGTKPASATIPDPFSTLSNVSGGCFVFKGAAGLLHSAISTLCRP